MKYSTPERYEPNYSNGVFDIQGELLPRSMPNYEFSRLLNYSEWKDGKYHVNVSEMTARDTLLIVWNKYAIEGNADQSQSRDEHKSARALTSRIEFGRYCELREEVMEENRRVKQLLAMNHESLSYSQVSDLAGAIGVYEEYLETYQEPYSGTTVVEFEILSGKIVISDNLDRVLVPSVEGWFNTAGRNHNTVIDYMESIYIAYCQLPCQWNLIRNPEGNLCVIWGENPLLPDEELIPVRMTGDRMMNEVQLTDYQNWLDAGGRELSPEDYEYSVIEVPKGMYRWTNYVTDQKTLDRTALKVDSFEVAEDNNETEDALKIASERVLGAQLECIEAY